MEFVSLRAEARTGRGKEFARKLRQQGLIPAIVYGPAGGPVPLAVSPRALHKSLETGAGENVLIRLEVGEGAPPRTVLVKSMQTDPLSGRLLHADFLEVSMDRAIRVEVPLVLVGEAVGRARGGFLELHLRAVHVECLPAAIPDRVTVDVSGLDLGDSLHVRDIRIAEGVRILEDLDRSLVSVAAPEVEKPAAEAVPAEAAPAEPEVVGRREAKEAGETPEAKGGKPGKEAPAETKGKEGKERK